MGRILVSSIEGLVCGTGREIGLALAKSVKPGDTVDFSGARTITNSFVDEFVWRFSAAHTPDAIKSLHFCGDNPLLRNLIQRAINRRVHNVRIVAPANPKVLRKSVNFISELTP